MKCKILFITGDRSEYDLLKPVAKELSSYKQFKLGFFVAGTHLIEKFGRTIDVIENDGFEIVSKINNLLLSDSPSARAKSLSIELASLVDTIDTYKPAMVVVLGDREETLAAAIACVYSRTICVHLCGGDSTSDGNSDNLVRDAVTKMAHIHFPSTEKSRKRILDLGEESYRVFNYGATGIDSLVNVHQISKTELLKSLGVTEDYQRFAVLIQHPILTDIEQSIADLRASLFALREIGIPTFVGRTNSDPGNIAFREILNSWCSENDTFHFYGNLDRIKFVNLLRNASVLVGNSSLGIIEAPYLKLPVVNVGLRQRGRESGENVIFVDGKKEDVHAAIIKATEDDVYRSVIESGTNPYGYGMASKLIAKKLSEIVPDLDKFRLKMQVK